MFVDIITLFPQAFTGHLSYSILKRAQEQGLVEINVHNLRSWAVDDYGTVDGRPYGGGKGMLLRPEPVFNAVAEIKKEKKSKTILLTPQGALFDQQKADNLANLEQIILICGHYEGVDERIRKNLVDQEISIGDYVLTGGEIPAMIVTDAVVRLLPNVLDKKATSEETFHKFLEYPQYTRPEFFRGLSVPSVLLSGNHQKIKKWRSRKAVEKTAERRPELLKK